MSPENIRHHAAGHLAAVCILINAGNAEGARSVLGIIKQFVSAKQVICPPRIKDIVDGAIAEPLASLGAVAQLEEWFVDPLNSTMEGAANG